MAPTGFDYLGVVTVSKYHVCQRCMKDVLALVRSPPEADDLLECAEQRSDDAAIEIPKRPPGVLDRPPVRFADCTCTSFDDGFHAPPCPLALDAPILFQQPPTCTCGHNGFGFHILPCPLGLSR
jgi:hypothetical protein